MARTKALVYTLDAVVTRLKDRGCRVTLQQLRQSIFLRATLPPRPGSNKTEPHSQRVATRKVADEHGFKAAEAMALKMHGDVQAGAFDWSDWIDVEAAEARGLGTVGEWVDRFEQHYFAKRARNARSQTTWDDNYRAVFKLLPRDGVLKVQVLEALLLSTTADSRQRLRFYLAVNALAKFAGLTMDLSRMKGNYSPAAVSP